MSDDLDVVMEADPLMPEVKRYPRGVGEALVHSFFDRDPYTRRHRSKSMVDFPQPVSAVTPVAMAAAAENGAGSGHGSGVPRLVSAEV